MKTLSNDITNTLDSNKTYTHLSTIVKELIENSIDAHATNISIHLQDNGLTCIEIKDNGNGMTKETMLALCKRFTSSKINTYADMERLDTFGFRGEALSILSYISSLTIVSKCNGDEMGYEAVYRNGKVVNTQLKAVSCEVGTSIKVDNIYYNNQIRRNVYQKNKQSELDNIISMIAKIAFHFVDVSFHLSNNSYLNKILFTSGKDNNTSSNSSNSKLEVRKSLACKLFKQQLNDELLMFSNCNYDSNSNSSNSNCKDNISVNNINNINQSFKYECYFTKPSAQIHKSKLILFVNNRLVKNNTLYRLFEQTYEKFLIKKGNYFAYVAITCSPDTLDVNVAANKGSVLFLNEDRLFEHFQHILESHLEEEINSKNYYIGQYKGFSNTNNNTNSTVYAKDKVRVDTQTVSIERFLSLNKIDSKHKDNTINTSYKADNSIQINNEQYINNCIFTAIYNSLFTNEVSNDNEVISTILKDNYYVGYDKLNYLTFIQYQTSLYIINTKLLLDEYFLYLTLSNSQLNKDTIVINPQSYSLSNTLQFINDNFPDKRTHLTNIANTINDICTLLTNISLSNNLFIFKDNVLHKITIYNFFNNDSFITEFITYIPMLLFSFIEHTYTTITSSSSENNNANAVQCNTNLNYLTELIQIYCHYLSNAYIEYLSKQTEEFIASFIRDIVLYNMKNDAQFQIRRNVKMSALIEKITDTETLYTVFERC